MARFAPSPETFVVEELPAYHPNGEGEHTYVWIEKRGLTTHEAERRLGQALGVKPRDIGHAGHEGSARHHPAVPEPAGDHARGGAGGRRRYRRPGVLEARRHGNKLRMGHLKGNRFELVLTEVTREEAADIAARLAELGRTGLPNWYGEQRFGAAGDNVERALAIVRGQLRERDWKKRQFLLSALQSAVFNRALELRQADGLLRVRAGDVLQKRESGGLFVCEDPAVDQPRVDAGELVPTGPLPGNREKEPPEGTAARALEDEALAAVGVTRAELAPLGRDLPGARRPVVVAVDLGDPPVERTRAGGGTCGCASPCRLGATPRWWYGALGVREETEPAGRGNFRSRPHLLPLAGQHAHHRTAARLHPARVGLGALAADRAVHPVGGGDGGALAGVPPQAARPGQPGGQPAGDAGAGRPAAARVRR